MNLAKMFLDQTVDSVKVLVQLVYFLLSAFRDTVFAVEKSIEKNAHDGEAVFEETMTLLKQSSQRTFYERFAAYLDSNKELKASVASTLTQKLSWKLFMQTGRDYGQILQEVRAEVFKQLDSGHFYIQLGDLLEKSAKVGQEHVDRTWPEMEAQLDRIVDDNDGILSRFLPMKSPAQKFYACADVIRPWLEKSIEVQREV